MKEQDFYTMLYSIVEKQVEKNGYDKAVIDAIIAQAALESAWGESILSSQFNNFFGMKCGTNWVGPSINMMTKEYEKGHEVKKRDAFRVYHTVEDGIAGYFEFLKFKRYANLKDCKSTSQYLKSIQEDGWATAPEYAKACEKVLLRLTNLTVKPSQSTEEKKDFFPHIGKEYELLFNMKVRKEPKGELVGYAGLTSDGKKHDKDKNGCLDESTIVTCQGFSDQGDSIWIAIPSGWICAVDKEGVYIQEVQNDC